MKLLSPYPLVFVLRAFYYVSRRRTCRPSIINFITLSFTLFLVASLVEALIVNVSRKIIPSASKLPARLFFPSVVVPNKIDSWMLGRDNVEKYNDMLFLPFLLLIELQIALFWGNANFALSNFYI